MKKWGGESCEHWRKEWKERQQIVSKLCLDLVRLQQTDGNTCDIDSIKTEMKKHLDNNNNLYTTNPTPYTCVHRFHAL